MKPYKLIKQKDGTWTLKNLDVFVAPAHHIPKNQSYSDEDLENASHNARMRKKQSGYYPPGQAFHDGDKDNKTVKFSDVDKARTEILKDYPLYDDEERLQPKDAKGMIVDVKNIPQIFKELIYEGRFPHRSVHLQRYKDTKLRGGIELRNLSFLPANKIPVIKLRPLIAENIEVIDDYPDAEAEFEDAVMAEFEAVANAVRKPVKSISENISKTVELLNKKINKNYVDKIHRHIVDSEYGEKESEPFLSKLNELSQNGEEKTLDELIKEAHNFIQGGSEMDNKDLIEALNRNSDALEKSIKLSETAAAKPAPKKEVPDGTNSRIPAPIVEYEAEFESAVDELLVVSQKDGVKTKPAMTKAKTKEILDAVRDSNYKKFAELVVGSGGVKVISSDNVDIDADGVATFESVFKDEAEALAQMGKKGTAPKKKIKGVEFEDICAEFGAPADSPMEKCIQEAYEAITPQTIQELKARGVVDEKGNADVSAHIETSLRMGGFIK